MDNTDMATCIICGKKYKTCLSCKDQEVIKPWRSITDNVDCYKIYLVLSKYNNGYIKKEEAQKQLSEIHYDLKDLKQSVRDMISKIVMDSEGVKKASPKNKTDK